MSVQITDSSRCFGLGVPLINRQLRTYLTVTLRRALRGEAVGTGDDRGIPVPLDLLLVERASQVGGLSGTEPLLTRSCTFGEPGTNGDHTCQDPSERLLGGQRHQCSNRGLCEDIRIEPRRINVLPQGIEIVLAEGTRDPQDLAVRNGTIGPQVFAMGLFTGVCSDVRYPTEPETDEYQRRDLERVVATLPVDRADRGLNFVQQNLDRALRTGLFAAGVEGEVCDPDKDFPLRNCLCREHGVTCATSQLLFGAPGDACVSGRCCEVCDGDACVDLETDDSNCGSCGNECPDGQSCTAGVCSP